MYTKNVKLNNREILIVKEKYIDKNVVRIYEIKSDLINNFF